jgi:hypothetical protein
MKWFSLFVACGSTLVWLLFAVQQYYAFQVDSLLFGSDSFMVIRVYFVWFTCVGCVALWMLWWNA